MEDKCRIDIDDTIAYYDHNAEEFVEITINADVSELYKPFEELLQYGAKILDLGCGSGRDSKYFVRRGYDVVAVDPSQAMCEQTRIYACVPVYKMKAEEMQFLNEFDGVWACASLLHVPREKQVETLQRLWKALKPDGICYCSWKYGDSDRFVEGRNFVDYNEETIRDLLKKTDLFIEEKIWISYDVRKGSQKQKWLNMIIKKRTAEN